jgi:hypothetical protein
MLISCPECERRVSDRAKACPDCGFPVAEELAAAREAEELARTVATREEAGREVDCPTCEARGYRVMASGEFFWCEICEHTGRVVLCKASDGYYAVGRTHVTAFVAGELHPGEGREAVFVGPEAPEGFRYEMAGERVTAEEEEAIAQRSRQALDQFERIRAAARAEDAAAEAGPDDGGDGTKG